MGELESRSQVRLALAATCTPELADQQTRSSLTACSKQLGSPKTVPQTPKYTAQYKLHV
jgi:hypothetical protein